MSSTCDKKCESNEKCAAQCEKEIKNKCTDLKYDAKDKAAELKYEGKEAIRKVENAVQDKPIQNAYEAVKNKGEELLEKGKNLLGRTEEKAQAEVERDNKAILEKAKDIKYDTIGKANELKHDAVAKEIDAKYETKEAVRKAEDKINPNHGVMKNAYEATANKAEQLYEKSKNAVERGVDAVSNTVNKVIN